MKTFNQLFLEAANSNKTIDFEYFKALDDNEEKARELVDEYAKSKGYNVVAWHGTPVGAFDKFKLSKSFGSVYFFAKTKEYAKYYANRFSGSPNPTVMELYLRITNPLKVERFEPEGVKTAYNIRKQGYDAVETPNAFIVFLPDQIKLSDLKTYKNNKIIPLSKRFNIDSDLMSH
jgi:hypothetical protein